MTEAQPPPSIAHHQPALSRWKWRCFVLTVLYVGAAMFFGYIAFGFSPRYEKIYEEMLGDRTKLPAYTQSIFSVSRFLQGKALFIGPLLLFLMPILLWVYRGNRGVTIVILLLIVLMVVFSVCAIPGLTIPLLELLESINRKS